MPSKRKPAAPTAQGDFETLVGSIVQIHTQAQDFATKAVNVGLTLRNWFIGLRIVEFEQNGNDRATYGEGLLDTLSKRLATHGLPQVTPRELRRYRQLYQVYPQIWQSVTAKSLEASGLTAMLALAHLPPSAIRETVTAKSQRGQPGPPPSIHRLSFTHLSELIQLPDDTERRFYEMECLRGNWSVRELRRQIESLYYQRSGLSKDKAFVEFALGDLSNKLFVSRYAVEMPNKREMERFLKEVGKAVGNEN